MAGVVINDALVLIDCTNLQEITDTFAAEGG
jgi:hypothetical protein